MPSPEGHRHLRASTLIRRLEAGAPLEELPEARECTRCAKLAAVLATGFGDLRAHAAEAAPAGASAGAPAMPSRVLALVTRSEELGSALAEAAVRGDEGSATRLLEGLHGDPAVAHAVLYACQSASRTAQRDPSRTLALSELAERFARREEARGVADLLGAEASLLASTSRLMLGEPETALELARAARSRMAAAAAPELSLARAKYHEAAALGTLGKTDDAVALLREARDDFAEAGQDHWTGRAEGAIGLALFQRSNDPEALAFMDAALLRLDGEADGESVAAIQQNRAGLLANLGRRDQARAGFSDALETALRCGATAVAISARSNLLSLALDEDRPDEVIRKGPRVLEQAEHLGLARDTFYVRLLLAEAHARKGDYSKAGALVAALRATPASELAGDPEVARELSRLDANDVEMIGRIRRVRALFTGRPEAEGLATG